METFRETLSWILDKTYCNRWDGDEERERIDFVHSLGLPCDCVGWSRLDLARGDSEEILGEIERFCREKEWTARGWYTREYRPAAAEWYCLAGKNFKGNEWADRCETVLTDGGATLLLPEIKACAILDGAPRRFGKYDLVPDRFRIAWEAEGLGGLRFCWLKDVGKYSGEQYFAVAPLHRAAHRDERHFLYRKGPEPGGVNREAVRLRELGGRLPRLGELFRELRVSLPPCFLRAELPDEGIGCAYVPSEHAAVGGSDTLLRADLAERLIVARALPRSALIPVLLCDAPEPGQVFRDTHPIPFPGDEALELRMAACARLLEKGRPSRAFRLKDALLLLRRRKRESPEAFGKAMPGKLRESLTATAFEPLAPVYAICAQAYLNDEYELLRYETAHLETESFQREMAAEELVEGGFPGIVFARCPDGDRVLLTPDGGVLRISHEEPAIICQWENLATFLCETVGGSG